MISKILVVAALLLASGLFLRQDQTDLFEAWALLHKKNYSPQEKSFRAEVFYRNLATIRQHNSKDSSFKLGLNQFADQTRQQIRATHANPLLAGRVGITNHCFGEVPKVSPLPTTTDWSKKFVNPPRKEGRCGSSWAFSATGTIQGYLAKSRNILRNLSVQQLLDCSKGYGNEGCSGGLMETSLYYTIDNGLTVQGEYPYIEKDNSCLYKPSMTNYKISECASMTPMKYAEFVNAAAFGPLSVAVDTDNPYFYLYSSGILTPEKCENYVDYGLLMVGFGDEGGKKFWKLRASLGTEWGEAGFIRVQREEADGKGTCGVQSGGFVVTN